MTLGITGIAHATAQTCIWTGATSNVMNVAGNWSSCNSSVPQAGDIITFPSWVGTPDSGSTQIITLNNNLGYALGGVTSTGSGATDKFFHFNSIALTSGATITSSNIKLSVDNLTSTRSITVGSGGIITGRTIQGTMTTSGTGPFIYGLTAANAVIATGSQVSVDAPNIGSPATFNFTNLTIQNGAQYTICSTSTTETDLTGTLTLGGGSGANPILYVSPCMGSTQTVAVSGGLKLKGSVVLASDATISAASNNISVDGSLTANGHSLTVTVDGTSSIMGDGATGNVTVSNGGMLAPGHSPGCLTVSNLTLNGSYQAQLGGTTACSGYDQTSVSGTTTLTGGSLDVEMYNSFAPATGQQFTIINNTSANPITGTFTSLPEGSTFTAGGATFKISYVGGDGNDVVITVLSGPGTPDTGFSITSAHPLVTLATSVIAALAILTLARISSRRATHRR